MKLIQVICLFIIPLDKYSHDKNKMSQNCYLVQRIAIGRDICRLKNLKKVKVK